MDGVGRNANHGAATSLLHLPADVLREFIFFHLSVLDIIKLAHTSVPRFGKSRTNLEAAFQKSQNCCT